MDRVLHSRRRFLCVGGAALVAGSAGCIDPSRTDEAPADSDARNDSDGVGGMDGGNDTDGLDGETDDEPIGDADDVGSGELDEPPGNGGADEGLGRGEDDRQGTVTTTVVVGPDGERVFDPETAAVQLGERVRWEWDSGGHTVTPADVPSNADWGGEPGEQGAGHVYEHRFEAAGTYEYYCAPHRNAGMTGTVEVRE